MSDITYPNRILNDRKGKFDIFTIYKQNIC